MSTFLGNAFSLQMLAEDHSAIKVDVIDPKDVPSDVASVVGHPDTANVISDVLGFDVPMNRVSLTLKTGDTLFVAQLVGGRLPEGATKLPSGFKFKWMKVTIL